MSPPLVSIVIPCHNQGRFLNEAIRSAARQTHAPVEIIVVDDGSTDHTARVAGRWRDVRLLRQPQRGVSAARNAGLRIATGEYVIFLDADDRLRPTAASAGLEALARTPGATFACGRAVGLDAGGAELPTRQYEIDGDPYLRLLAANYAWMPGMVIFRRDAAVAAGGFDETLGGAADYDFYLSLAQRNRPALHDGIVAEYRQHDASMSRDSLVMWGETRRVLRHHRARAAQVRGGAEAWRRGDRAWRAYYGERLIEDASRLWHTARKGRCLRLLAAAAWCDPHGLLRHLRRKVRFSFLVSRFSLRMNSSRL